MLERGRETPDGRSLVIMYDIYQERKIHDLNAITLHYTCDSTYAADSLVRRTKLVNEQVKKDHYLCYCCEYELELKIIFVIVHVSAYVNLC